MMTPASQRDHQQGRQSSPYSTLPQSICLVNRGSHLTFHGKKRRTKPLEKLYALQRKLIMTPNGWVGQPGSPTVLSLAVFNKFRNFQKLFQLHFQLISLSVCGTLMRHNTNAQLNMVKLVSLYAVNRYLSNATSKPTHPSIFTLWPEKKLPGTRPRVSRYRR